jgi:hypothetical protein
MVEHQVWQDVAGRAILDEELSSLRGRRERPEDLTIDLEEQRGVRAAQGAPFSVAVSPSSPTSTLLGFRSWWTMPRRWA